MKKNIGIFIGIFTLYLISPSVFALHGACLGHELVKDQLCVGWDNNGAIGTGCGCCPNGWKNKNENSLEHICR